MKCLKLHLQERLKPKPNRTCDEKPRRFCQKRMVDPEHQEDPRWTDTFEKFYCNDPDNCDLNETNECDRPHQDRDILFLSVQNLQFQGSIEQRTRPRTSFKYKTLPNSQNHRMFVKEPVDDTSQDDIACSSNLSDYRDDYTKYFTNNNQSRPSSSKSSIVVFCLNSKFKENKSVQVDLKTNDSRKIPKVEKIKTTKKCFNNSGVNNDLKYTEDYSKVEDTKISFRKSGKRKSLTISRTESPATVQVIRVDVVCNYSCSSTMSDYDDSKKESIMNEDQDNKENKKTKSRKSHFSNKYMLTNTVKTLDENISGGKVTLMCKTYKLTDRTKISSNRNPKTLLGNPNQGKNIIQK